MESLLQNELLVQLVLALLASSALVTFFNDSIAQFVARIPLVGGVLSLVVRRFSAQFWDWLATRVKESAETAVRTADVVAGNAPGTQKKIIAMSTLQAAEPGLTNRQLDEEIEMALSRLKVDAARTAKAVTQAVLHEAVPDEK